jgi:hypothetical protein
LWNSELSDSLRPSRACNSPALHITGRNCRQMTRKLPKNLEIISEIEKNFTVFASWLINNAVDTIAGM